MPVYIIAKSITNVEWCWLMLTDADWPWLMLTDADWCSTGFSLCASGASPVIFCPTWRKGHMDKCNNLPEVPDMPYLPNHTCHTHHIIERCTVGCNNLCTIHIIHHAHCPSRADGDIPNLWEIGWWWSCRLRIDELQNLCESNTFHR